jgi:hypothetical protein
MQKTKTKQFFLNKRTKSVNESLDNSLAKKKVAVEKQRKEAFLL